MKKKLMFLKILCYIYQHDHCDAIVDNGSIPQVDTEGN